MIGQVIFSFRITPPKHKQPNPGCWKVNKIVSSTLADPWNKNYQINLTEIDSEGTVSINFFKGFQFDSSFKVNSLNS